jgi:hypothetical protein
MLTSERAEGLLTAASSRGVVTEPTDSVEKKGVAALARTRSNRTTSADVIIKKTIATKNHSVAGRDALLAYIMASYLLIYGSV